MLIFLIIFVFAVQLADAYMTKRVLERSGSLLKEFNPFIRWLCWEINIRFGLFFPKFLALGLIVIASAVFYFFIPSLVDPMKAFLLASVFVYFAIMVSNYFIYQKYKRQEAADNLYK